MSSDHVCCESCVKNLEEGYGDDLIYLGFCCCKAERSMANPVTETAT